MSNKQYLSPPWPQDVADVLSRLLKMHKDLLVLVQQSASPCTGGDGEHFRLPEGHLLQCPRLATLKVTWSDREACVCREHLPHAKQWAARDNSGDRTDDPFVDEFTPDEIVQRYWPEVLKMATKPGTNEPFPIVVIDLPQEALQESIDSAQSFVEPFDP